LGKYLSAAGKERKGIISKAMSFLIKGSMGILLREPITIRQE
jgi:hypothetical protein